MGRFGRFGGPPVKVLQTSSTGVEFIDYHNAENLRRMMSPNGKILGRKRTNLNAANQRKLAQAIKRARYMALLPYTSATV